MKMITMTTEKWRKMRVAREMRGIAEDIARENLPHFGTARKSVVFTPPQQPRAKVRSLFYSF